MTSASYARQDCHAKNLRPIEEAVSDGPLSPSYPPDNPPQFISSTELEEVWLPMVCYEGRYAISNLGRIKSVPYVHPRTGNTLRGRILKTTIERDGYERFRAVSTKNIRIHRAVAMAFIPNPDSLEMVNHIDGNKLNNRLDNLEWVSRAGNTAHAIQAGLIDTEHLRSLSGYRKDKVSDQKAMQIIDDCKAGLPHQLIASKYGVSVGTVSNLQKRA